MKSFEQLIHTGFYLSLDWAEIELDGPDALDFLDRQATVSIKNLAPKEFKSGALLNVDGKIESYFLVKKVDQKVILHVPKDLLTETVDRIEKFHIMEEFVIHTKDKSPVYLYFGYDEIKDSHIGEFAGVACELTSQLPAVDKLDNTQQDLFFKLVGFDNNLKDKLITSTLLSRNSLELSKGCFPGQEPVSKIINNRGAAFYPVLLEISEPLESFEKNYHYMDRVVAKNQQSFSYQDRYFIQTEIVRDFRVEDKTWIFEDKKEIKATVRYYPLIKANRLELSSTIFEIAAKLSLSSNSQEQALKLLNKAIRLNPANTDAIEITGVLYANQQDYSHAIEYMKKLSEVDSSSIMAQTNMSLYYMKMGEIELAEKHQQEATYLSFKAQAPKEDQRVKERENKLAMFFKVLEIDAEDAMANLGVGQIYFETERFEEAVTYLKKVIAIDPNYSQGYLYLAKTYAALENKKKAIDTLLMGIPVATKKGELMPANEMEALRRELALS